MELLKSGGLAHAEETLTKQLMCDKEDFQGRINELSQDLKVEASKSSVDIETPGQTHR
jgi:hypothetical protein